MTVTMVVTIRSLLKSKRKVQTRNWSSRNHRRNRSQQTETRDSAKTTHLTSTNLRILAWRSLTLWAITIILWRTFSLARMPLQPMVRRAVRNKACRNWIRCHNSLWMVWSIMRCRIQNCSGWYFWLCFWFAVCPALFVYVVFYVCQVIIILEREA